MANLFLALAVPAADGVGAAVDTSALGEIRTLTIEGSFSATVTIEVANDAGVQFVPIASFTRAGKKTIKIAARFMRVRVTGASGPVVASVDVAANDTGGLYLTIPSTAGDGTGASISVATLGTFNTAVVTGDFSGQVVLQISEDGVDWADCMVFSAPGKQSKEFVAQFARVVRSGSNPNAIGSASIDLGAINDAAASGAAVAGATTACLVYRQGAPDTGPTVFGTWAAVIAKLASIRAANNGAGCYQIEFDDSLLAGANMSIPAGGPYPMKDVEWIARRTGRPEGFPSDTNVELLEGATFAELRQFRGNLHVRNLATATVPNTDMINGSTVICAEGVQLDSQSGLVPMYRTSGFASGNGLTVLLFDTSAVLSAVGRPVFDMPIAGTTIRLNIQSGAQIGPDTIGGAAGTFLFAFVNASTAIINPTQPLFLGSYFDFPFTLVRMFADQAIAAANTTLTANQIARFDATAAARTATLLPATRIRGQFVGIVNELGQNNVVVTPAAGDTINGLASMTVGPGESMMLTSDGLTNWIVMAASSVAAKMTSTTAQNLGVADATIVFDTVAYDTGAGAVLASNHFAVPRAGLYEITGRVAAASVGGNVATIVNIAVNGVNLESTEVDATVAAFGTSAQVTATLSLAAGDLVTLVGRHSGGVAAVVTVDSRRPMFTIAAL